MPRTQQELIDRFRGRVHSASSLGRHYLPDAPLEEARAVMERLDMLEQELS